MSPPPRTLPPLVVTDPAEVSRLCARWITDVLGCTIVDFGIGNRFIGSIDFLAVSHDVVHLVTVDTGSFADALLGAFTGYWWFVENRAFLDRIYGSEDTPLMGDVVLVILSRDPPRGIQRILPSLLKVKLRLFRYATMGTAEEPFLCVEELTLDEDSGGETHEAGDVEALVRELGIEEAGLDGDEIRRLIAALRAA
ncbi:MAG TPA: hypothetical protein PLQ43_06885 [Deltaproteobacteria bacterium]|nr:hypothetical protein [Deltaproteobacteria bacterium]